MDVIFFYLVISLRSGLCDYSPRASENLVTPLRTLFRVQNKIIRIVEVTDRKISSGQRKFNIFTTCTVTRDITLTRDYEQISI